MLRRHCWWGQNARSVQFMGRKEGIDIGRGSECCKTHAGF